MLDVMPISQTGREKLKEELSNLEEEAAELRVRVAEARDLGDLKENGEFIYGRQNLGFVEGKMGEIRAKINRSEPVDCTTIPCNTVDFGTVVTIRDLDSKEEFVYQLLGAYDFDLTDDTISILSPVGKALLDHAVGDKVTVNAPRGELHFQIQKITKSEFK